MEIMFAAWFFGGLIMGFICCHLAYKGVEEDDSIYQTEHDGDSDIRIYHLRRIRDRRGMDRHLYAQEEVKSVLYTFRAGASTYEKDIIDAAIDMIEGSSYDKT